MTTINQRRYRGLARLVLFDPHRDQQGPRRAVEDAANHELFEARPRVPAMAFASDEINH